MRSPIVQSLTLLFSLALLASLVVWPAAAQNQASALDPSKLPDISGIHLGMSLADAAALMKKLYPRGVGVMNGGPLGPQHQNAVGVLRAQGDGADMAGVDLTMPPNPQVVWHVSRDLVQANVAHNTLVAGLRQKYGKETYAADRAGSPAKDDSQILHMWWLFDEQGHLMPQAPIIKGVPLGCQGAYLDNTTGVPFDFYRAMMAGNNSDMPSNCFSSYVGVLATMSTDPILRDFTMDIVDLPLAQRSAAATAAWANAQNDKARQENQQRANQAKPTL